MSVGTSGSTINPKPFFSLNHLTVPLAIESTERANHPAPDSCQNSRNFHPIKRLAPKRPPVYKGHAKNVKRNATLLFPVGYVLRSSSPIALFSLCLKRAWLRWSWEASLIGQPCAMRRICSENSASRLNLELFPVPGLPAW